MIRGRLPAVFFSYLSSHTITFVTDSETVEVTICGRFRHQRVRSILCKLASGYRWAIIRTGFQIPPAARELWTRTTMTFS